MQSLKILVTMLSLSVLPIYTYSQGLFESAAVDSAGVGNTQSDNKRPEVTGFVKGAIFGGQDENNKPDILGSYGQTSIKLKADKNGIGAAFAEVRLDAGNERGMEQVACNIREAWGSVALKGIDIRLGRQIIVWGRADGINPTNNITPKNELALSSEQDDTRMGNELLQIKAPIGQSSIQGIWVPYFRPDVLPLNSATIPSGVVLGDPFYPNHNFKNGSYALRFDFNAASLDGSVSYFNGYSTLPGFDYEMNSTGLLLIPKAYRMQVIGTDFSTTVGANGLRAEAAIKYPSKDYENQPSIPNPYAQVILGVDRSIGDLSLLVQYAGLYVIDFKKISDPELPDFSNPMAIGLYYADLSKAKMTRMNRLFTGTSDEFSHSFTANLQWSTLHETLHLKLTGLYDITTQEYAVVPEATYDVADAVSLTIGGRYLDGKKESLNDLVSNLMTHVYTELKYSF